MLIKYRPRLASRRSVALTLFPITDFDTQIPIACDLVTSFDVANLCSFPALQASRATVPDRFQRRGHVLALATVNATGIAIEPDGCGLMAAHAWRISLAGLAGRRAEAFKIVDTPINVHIDGLGVPSRLAGEGCSTPFEDGCLVLRGAQFCLRVSLKSACRIE
jgi:hypothetical protein